MRITRRDRMDGDSRVKVNEYGEFEPPLMIKIIKNETGESVVIKSEAGSFNWEEGNYACDCNRELFFERAKGNDPYLDSTHCSENRFSIEYLDDKQLD